MRAFAAEGDAAAMIPFSAPVGRWEPVVGARKPSIPFPGPVGRWELVVGARKPWVYCLRIVYALVLLFAIGFSWPRGARSISEMARVGFQLSQTLLILHAIVVLLGTPLWVADLVAGARRSARLELLFATDLTRKEIVFGGLVARLAGVALLSFGGLPALALAGLLGGLDYGLLFTAFWLTLLTLAWCGSMAVYYSVVAVDTERALARTYLRIVVLTCLPGGSPLWLWYPALAGDGVAVDNHLIWMISALVCCITTAVYLHRAVGYLRYPQVRGPDGELADLDRPDPARGAEASMIVDLFAYMAALGFGIPVLATFAIDFAGQGRPLEFLINLASVLSAPVLLAALHLAVRSPCLNGWLDRRSGQAYLILATSLSNGEILLRLVLGRRSLRKAWRTSAFAALVLVGSALLAPSINDCLIASFAAWALAAGLAICGAAVATLMMLAGRSPRIALAYSWGILLAGCLIPLLAPLSAMWGAVVGALIAAAFGRLSAPLARAATAVGLFLSAGSIGELTFQWWMQLEGTCDPVFNPALALFRLMTARGKSSWDDLTESISAAAGVALAAAACWFYVWAMFDWLVERPRRRIRTEKGVQPQ